MTVISIPRILRDRLTDEGADASVQILDKVEERSQKATLEIAEEKFEKRLAQVETNIIRWMFIFWVGQIGVITAIFFTFLKR